MNQQQHQQQYPHPQQYPHQPGLWESIRMIFASSAMMITKLSGTMERAANVLDVTISTGEVMAESTHRKVRYSTMGEEAETINNLVARYPELEELIAEESQK